MQELSQEKVKNLKNPRKSRNRSAGPPDKPLTEIELKNKFGINYIENLLNP